MMHAYLQRWSLIKNSAEQISDERAIDAFIAGVRRRDLVEELGRAKPSTVGNLMDIANKRADGEDALQNKRQRSPEEDRNRASGQNRRRYRNFNEYDGPSHVAASFRSSSGNNHRDDYCKDNGYRSDNRDAHGSSRPSNRSRHFRDFNKSPEELMNGPCQMHVYINSQGVKESGHLLKDCRTFQALRRVTDSTQAEAVSRGYAQGPRSKVHVPPPPPQANTNGVRHNQLQIVGPTNTHVGYTQPR